MIKRTLIAAFSALVGTVSAGAQPSTDPVQATINQFAKTSYKMRLVAWPGMKIDGFTIENNMVIGTAIVSDKGEVAFVACYNSSAAPCIILTLHRVVVSPGDTVDGKKIAVIPADGRLSINSAGTVAYDALVEGMDLPENFVEQHYAQNDNPDLGNYMIWNIRRPALNDSGELVAEERVDPSACWEGHILELNELQHRKPPCGPFPMLHPNRLGEVAIPVNSEDGPYLFVVTPRHK